MVNSARQGIFLFKIVLIGILFLSFIGAKGEDIWQLPNVSDKELAVDLYRSGDYWGAINKLEAYLLKHPDDNEAKKLLGDSYFEVAKQSFQQKNYVESIQLFKKSLKYNEKNPEAWYLMGLAYREQGRKDDAIGALERARAISGDYKDTSRLLVDLYLERGKEEYKYGHYSKSSEYLTRALKIQPDNLEVHFYLGLDYYFLKKWDLARRHLTESLKSDKFALYSNFYLGFIAYQLGQFEKAVPYFLKSEQGELKDKSRYYLSLCYYNIATKAYNDKDYEKARVYYGKVLELYPDHVDAHLGLALVYFNTEKYFKAAEHLEKIKKLKGNYRNTYALLGEVYFRIAKGFLKKGKLKEAEKYFTLCYRNDVNRGDAYYNLAEIYYKWKKYGKAIDFYEKSIARKYRIVDSTYKVGEIYFITGEYKKAIRELEQVYGWKKNYHRTVYYLWVAYKRLGEKYYRAKNYTDAEFYLSKSLFYNPNQPGIRFKYAVSLYNNKKFYAAFEELKKLMKEKQTKFDGFWSYLYRASLKAGISFYEARDYTRAIDVLKEHINYFPKSVDGHYYLGLAYNRVGEFQLAIDHLRFVIKEKGRYKDSYKEISYAYREAGKKFFADGDFEKARKYLRNALIYNTGDLEARYYYGWSLLKLGMYKKAVKELEDVYGKDSNFRRVRYLLAKAYSLIADPLFTAGKYRYAAKLYKRLVELYPENPDFNMKYGLSLFHSGKYDEAVDYLKKAVTFGADYLTCNYYIGEIYYIKHQYKRAYSYFMSVYQKKHTFKNVKERFAEVSYILGEQYEKDGDLNSAVEMYMNAYNLFPDKFRYILAAARTLKALGDNENSIKLYERLVGKFPGYKAAYIDLAELYLKTGRFEDCIALLEKTKKIKNEKLRRKKWLLLQIAYVKYTDYLVGHGNFEKAVQVAKKGLKIFPRDQDLMLLMARSYVQLGKFDRAMRILGRINSRRYRDKLYRLYLELGKKAMDEGNFSVSIKALKKAYGLKVTGDVIFYLAYGYDKMNDLDRAYHYLKELHRKFPHYPFISDLAREVIGKKLELLIKNERYREAERFFSEAREILPTYGYMYYLMGKMYYDMKKYDLAISYLKTCEKYEGSDFKQLSKLLSDSYLALAKASYKKGKLTDSLNYLSRSLKYSKENPEAYILMARIYRDQNNELMARDYLGRAILLNPAIARSGDVEKLGYSLGITNSTDWKKFMQEIGVRGWPSAVTQ